MKSSIRVRYTMILVSVIAAVILGIFLFNNFYLESYVAGKGMTMKTKIRIMVTVTLLMAIGFIMMKQVLIGRIVLGAVWVFHMVYFLLGVKTIKTPVVE